MLVLELIPVSLNSLNRARLHVSKREAETEKNAAYYIENKTVGIAHTLTKSNLNSYPSDWYWSRGGGLAVYETGTVLNLSLYYLFDTKITPK